MMPRCGGKLAQAQDSFFRSMIVYETPRLVKVHNVKLGVIVRFCQIAVMFYVITYAIYLEKGYQMFGAVESSVTMKLKGTSRSRLLDSEAALLPVPEWRNLYNRVWDVADYVVPPAENGAVFVTTNVVITPNQTQGRCPEGTDIREAVCSVDDDCVEGEYLKFGHGPMTGRCVDSDVDTELRVCEIETWCPVEQDQPRLQRAIMDRADGYTVFIKNSIAFPMFGAKYRRNNVIPGPSPSIYDPVENPLGQIFWLGDIVRLAGGNFTLLSIKGGVVSVSIQWRCDLDFDFEQHCLPFYTFRVLDSGWNFRHAHFHEESRRTLVKVFGLRFVITVDGIAGKFSLRNTVLNVGNGLALLGMTTLIGEFFLTYFAKDKKDIAKKKYESVDKLRKDTLKGQRSPNDNGVAAGTTGNRRLSARRASKNGIDLAAVESPGTLAPSSPMLTLTPSTSLERGMAGAAMTTAAEAISDSRGGDMCCGCCCCHDKT